MFCPNCGKERNGQDCFCSQCGTALTPASEQTKKKPHSERGALLILSGFLGLIIVLLLCLILFKDMLLPEKQPAQNQAAPVLSEPKTEPKPAKDKTTDVPSEILTSQQIAAMSESAVCIYVYDYYGSYIGSGSGFLYQNSDIVVTNFHVISGASFIEIVTHNENSHWTEAVIHVDEAGDLAVLKLEEPTGLPVLETGDSHSVVIGDPIYAIGNPLDVGATVSSGMISAIQKEDGYTDFQITAPISPGSSGGPLLNEKGQVVGIIYATITDGQNLNYAIPAWELEKVDLNQKPIDLFTFGMRYASYGNLYENYSSAVLSVAESYDYMFASDNPSRTIYYTNFSDDSYLDIGCSGTWLSVYRDTLFFLPLERDAIYSYDVSVEKRSENLLRSYPEQAQVERIQKFFVTDEGFTVIHETQEGTCALLQLDHYGEVLGVLNDIDYTNTILVEGLEAAVSIPETNCIRYIPLNDPSQYYDVTPMFSVGSRLSYGGGSYLYATDSNDSAVIHRFDMYTGDETTLTPAGWNTLAFGVHEGVLYYTGDGLWMMPAEGGTPEQITSGHSLMDLNFFAYNMVIGPTEGPNFQWLSIDPDSKEVFINN